MTRVDLKHIHRFRDRHGVTRHYLRVPGQKAVPLAGSPGSPEFMAAYAKAIEAAPAPLAKARTASGSLDDVAVRYYAGNAFQGLRASSQATYRRIVEDLRRGHGAKPIRLIDEIGVRKLMDEKQGMPAAANHRLRVIRALIRQAMQDKIIAVDPTKDVEKHKQVTKGHKPWTEGMIEQYRARHPSGTVARLALELLLNTGQRRSDTVRMGRQHREGGALRIRQVKTGVVVTIPILPELEVELAHVPAGQLTFLETDGHARSANGFYNMFTFWCEQAGIPAGFTPHGLRKAQGRRLAEAGCSAPEIMAILGHLSLAEAQKYINDFNRERMAHSGMARVAHMNAAKGTKSE